MKLNQIAYTISEVHELLGIGRTKIYEIIKNKELTACKVGRRTLVTADALEQWMSNLPSSADQSAGNEASHSAGGRDA